MRVTFPALFVCLLGCVPPGSGEAEAGSAELELRSIEVERGWRLELRNEGEVAVELGCAGPYCEVPTLRYEALQEDGSWVERASVVRFARELSRASTVPPGGSFVLPRDLRDLDAAPGTFRAVVHTRDAGEVSLEYAVVGWSTETLRAALAIRARADAARCWRLVSACGGRAGGIDRALIGHLESDALIDLHEGSAPDARPAIREAMLRRGGFVGFLGELLSVEPMDTVREVAEWLGTRADPVQEPLRAPAARRLTGPLGGSSLVSAEDYVLIHHLERYWPEGTAEQIVRRLERGPEEGAALVALLDVLGSSRGPAFDSHGPRILAALPARCDGATDARLMQRCERVAIVYDPDTDFGFGGLGVRGTGCGGCGSSYHPPPICDQIHRDWRALEAEAGELELVWLAR